MYAKLREQADRRFVEDQKREEKRIELLARLSTSRQPNLALIREALIFLLGGP